MYVRIKPPVNKNQDVPQSITVGGVKGVRIVPGGPGVEVKNTALINRLKKIGGDKIEVSKKPFKVNFFKGGVIDLSAGEMKGQVEVDSEGNTVGDGDQE